MSGHELECLHCSIMRQIKLCIDSGYTYDNIANCVVTAMADVVALTRPNVHQIDAISDDIRDCLVQGIKDRVLLMRSTEGRA